MSSSNQNSDEYSPLLPPIPASFSATSPISNGNLKIRTWISKCAASLTPSQRNKGMMLILVAEFVGASMDATARYLQQSDGWSGRRGIHVFQVIFSRMSITWILSSFYLWWNNVPDFPLGNPKVRVLLFLRGLFGFLGLICLYYSVHYLPLSEATIIRFLVPLMTTILCSILLAQAFTSRDAIGGILAFAGVVVMAHPDSIFGHNNNGPIFKPTATPVDPVTPKTHLIAVAVALLGVFFASGAYTMIRLIGNQAHALISVSYFSAIATVSTFLALLLRPTESMRFVLPASFQEWFLLIGLGFAGFILQFLLTAGLQMDKSSRATSMLYLQVVLAGALDWIVWGVLPKGWSLIGGGVVIASTLWLALGKSSETEKKREDNKSGDEESGALREEEDDENETDGQVGENVVTRRASISA